MLYIIFMYDCDFQVCRGEKHDFVDDGKKHKLVIDNVDSEDIGTYRAEYMLLTTQGKLSVQGMLYLIYALRGIPFDNLGGG